MEKEFVLELDTAHYLREIEETDDDILYPDSRYYRKDKKNFALHKNNRIYEPISKSQPWFRGGFYFG